MKQEPTKQKYSIKDLAEGKCAKDVIPTMTHPFGKHWEQPKLSDIFLDDVRALMTEQTMKQLLEYSSSIPSGVYEGKMWRSQLIDKNDVEHNYLHWWSESDDPNKCSHNTRDILIAESAKDLQLPVTDSKEENKEEEGKESKAPDCSKHLKSVAGISDMKALAEMIGDLHYETLADLFEHLSNKIIMDAAKDRLAGRNKLARTLELMAHGVCEAQLWAEEVWEISKPFMAEPQKVIQTCKTCGIFVFTHDGTMCMNGHPVINLIPS